MEIGLPKIKSLHTLVLFFCCLILFTGQMASNTHRGTRINLSKTAKPSTVKSTLARQTTKPTVKSTLARHTTAPTDKSTLASQTTVRVSDCQPVNYPECPKGWIFINNNKCLLISRDIINYRSWIPPDECVKYGASKIDEWKITTSASFHACLLRAMEDHPEKSILLASHKVMNLRTSEVTSLSYRYYTVEAYLACVIDRNAWELPRITSFQVKITNEINGTHRVENLLDNEHSVTIVEQPEDLLTFSCQATGIPQPQVKVNFVKNEYSLLAPFYADIKETTYTVRGSTCIHSGVYGCVASNAFGSVNVTKEIQVLHDPELSEINMQIQNYHYSEWPIHLGSTVNIKCSVHACPAPQLLSITDGSNIVISSSQTNQVSVLLSRVSCSDMGPYNCVFESRSGARLQRRLELKINDRCPVQRCRGQHEPSIFSVSLGQTFNISLCLMSNGPPTFLPQPPNQKVSVTFMRTPSSQVLLQAQISILNISHADYRSYSLDIRNFYGSLMHNFTLIPEGLSVCPSSVKEISRGPSHISLSWQHMFAFSYHVFYSANEKTWSYWHVPEGATSTTITGLAENTKYFFRIAALLSDFEVVDETTCNFTVVLKTGSQPHTLVSRHSDVALRESHVPIITVPLIAVNVALIIMFAAFVYWKRGNIFQKTRDSKTTNLAAGPNFGTVNDQFESNSLLGSEHSSSPLTTGRLVNDTEL